MEGPLLSRTTRRAYFISCAGLSALLALACASGGPRPAPGLGAIEGRVRLEPREGVSAHAGGNAYGDRRLRDARRVDYDHPGFTVVYTERADSSLPAVARDADTPLALTIREGAVGPRLEPALTALRLRQAIAVTNATDAPHVLSIPGQRVVRSIQPGESLRVVLASAGPHRLFLLDVPDGESLVFAAPGPFAVTDASGDYALSDLAPGPVRIHAWHPRFPPTAADVIIEADTVGSLDLVLGVGRESARAGAEDRR